MMEGTRSAPRSKEYTSMNILMGTDGSRYALAAARFLADALRAEGSRVELIAVTPVRPKSDRRHRGKNRTLDQQWRGEVLGWLEGTSEILEGRGFAVRRRRESGLPARVIVDAARSGMYDLVVTGAKGRGGAPFFGAGSVALALLEQAPVPVLLVRERDPNDRGERPAGDGNAVRVLLAADGSDGPRRGIALLLDRFRRELLDVEVITAVEGMDGPVVERLAPQHREALAAEARREGRRRLNEARNLLETRDVRVTALLLEGRAIDVILDRARMGGADLVVMGSRGVPGATGPEPARLGSTALTIACSAPCSVLLVPSQP
jgi:nucleotide-binding universal stress UspA family protein